MTSKDAFDLWWEWADKPVDNKPTIEAAIYDAVMALPPDERRVFSGYDKKWQDSIGQDQFLLRPSSGTE